MAAPAYIAAEVASVGNDATITVPMTSALAAVPEGSLLVAVFAAGDVSLGSAGIPVDAAGDPLWVRPTQGSIVETGAALEGELLVRKHAGPNEPDEHVFSIEQDVSSGLANEAAIVAAIIAIENADLERTVRAVAETVNASSLNSHVAPTVTPDLAAGETGLLLALHFLWFANTSASVDGAMTERSDVSVLATGGGTDRDVALLVGDEAVVGPSATGTRTGSTPSEAGTSNSVSLVIGSSDDNDEGLTAFNLGIGTDQGRIDPLNYTPPEGSFAFVLGSDIAGQLNDLEVGDYVEAKQTADFDTTTVVRVTVRTRAPVTMPAGIGWKFSLRIDGSERASQILVPDDDLVRDRELAANVSQLAGDHELALRLELVNV